MSFAASDRMSRHRNAVDSGAYQQSPYFIPATVDDKFRWDTDLILRDSSVLMNLWLKSKKYESCNNNM